MGLLGHFLHLGLIGNILSGALLGPWRGGCDGELLVEPEDIIVLVCAGELADVLWSCLFLSGLIRVTERLGEWVRRLRKRARIVCPTALGWAEVVTVLALAVGQVEPEVIVEIGLSAAGGHLIVHRVSLQIDLRLFVPFGALRSGHPWCIVLSGHDDVSASAALLVAATTTFAGLDCLVQILLVLSSGVDHRLTGCIGRSLFFRHKLDRACVLRVDDQERGGLVFETHGLLDDARGLFLADLERLLVPQPVAIAHGLSLVCWIAESGLLALGPEVRHVMVLCF